jgi:hypothetical protein
MTSKELYQRLRGRTERNGGGHWGRHQPHGGLSQDTVRAVGKLWCRGPCQTDEPLFAGNQGGGFVFTSAEITRDTAAGKLSGGDSRAQADERRRKRVLTNISMVLARVGSGMQRVVKTAGDRVLPGPSERGGVLGAPQPLGMLQAAPR